MYHAKMTVANQIYGHERHNTSYSGGDDGATATKNIILN
jgi:hypothetical protein